MATKPMIEKEPSVVSDEEESAPAEGVKVPEVFQQEVHTLVNSATTKEMLSYISSCVSDAQMDMSKTASEEEFSADDEPKE